MYVTLEPCDHVGRTGPCTAALIAARPARVVVGCGDPNPIVDGRGLVRLRRAGIRVDVGCLEAECRAAIRAYSVWVRERRPLVTLKAAATLDGCIADRRPRRQRAPQWITGPEARRAAHELRAAHDAVLVGAGTVRADDPRLTVRLGGRRRGPVPLRVVLAGRAGVPRGARVLRGGAPTLVIPGRPPLRRTLAVLAKRDIQSVLVEGGARVFSAFVAAGLVDRVALFVAPHLLGGGVPIADGPGLPVARGLQLGPLSVRRVGEDLLIAADVIGR
jgi:diaminohydroxyphosphoribosylaminopyrimidine deaminase/5-amino-6-(5-phosphoribosylamino)uracil reductase